MFSCESLFPLCLLVKACFTVDIAIDNSSDTDFCLWWKVGNIVLSLPIPIILCRGDGISIEVGKNEAECQETIPNPVNLSKFLHYKTWSSNLNFPEPLLSMTFCDGDFPDSTPLMATVHLGPLLRSLSLPRLLEAHCCCKSTVFFFKAYSKNWSAFKQVKRNPRLDLVSKCEC